MVERFPFLPFPFGWEKTDNKDSERWRRKERRDVINEFQHLRRDGPAAGGGGSGVLLISPWLQMAFFPVLSPTACQACRGRAGLSPSLLIDF